MIRDSVPSGFNIRTKAHRFALGFDFDTLRCAKHIRTDNALLSLGSLGGGNHFIEMDKDDNGDLYISTTSRPTVIRKDNIMLDTE